MAALAGGGYIVVWQSVGQDGSGASIHYQRFAASGGLVGSETRVNRTTAGDQTRPAAAALPGGAFAIGWKSRAPSTTSDKVIARLYGPNGGATTGEIALDGSATDQDI